MGRGIVDPPDDFNQQNQPSVPELLEHLASYARENQWDIREMVRKICLSEAYQHSSVTGTRDEKLESLFLIKIVKPMTAEQLLDSLQVALDWELPETRQELIQLIAGERFDEDFSETWKYRETVQQLMGRLAMDLRAPTEDLDELFFRILTRRPTETERAKCQRYNATDVAFALVNTNEFYFNH